MRALVKQEAGPGLVMTEVPEPEIGINDVLIRVDRTGICGTDLHIEEWNVWDHEPSIDRDVAAIFDPFGNAVHAALQFPVLGEDVLITGAGPIGLMAAAVVRHAGARYIVITDVKPYRLELARKIGV